MYMENAFLPLCITEFLSVKSFIYHSVALTTLVSVTTDNYITYSIFAVYLHNCFLFVTFIQYCKAQYGTQLLFYFILLN